MTMEPEHARVRSYLVGQAEKLSVDEIWAKVDASFVELTESVSGKLTPVQLAFKTGPDEWSITEVMSHLLSSNVNTCRTIGALARGAAVSRNAGGPGKTSATDDFVALVAENREVVWRTVQELPADPALEPTSPHGMFGPLNCKAWLLFIRLHNLDHANQVKKVREQSNFAP